jgi:hypothetical protein
MAAIKERMTLARLGSAGYSQVEDTDPDNSANTGCKGTADSSNRIPSHLLLAQAKKSTHLDPASFVLP